MTKEKKPGPLVPGKIIKNTGTHLMVDLDGYGIVEIANRFAATKLDSKNGGYLFDVDNLDMVVLVASEKDQYQNAINLTDPG